VVDAMAPSDKAVKLRYAQAREQYAELGVDTDQALARLSLIPVSIHCWQGDDVGGFESDAGIEGAGIMATGNYPGRARTVAELRLDFEQALRLIPGPQRFNLHAIYADTAGRRVERDQLGPGHFASWVGWARGLGIGLDFNPTFFAHPKADDGFTLASRDEGIRRFWVRHGIACRHIAAYMGRELGSPCVNNIWIPDGYKDVPADRKTPRLTLQKSLDEILAEKLDPAHTLDAVESKLFGLGTESYVVGSHEFYMGYGLTRNVMICIDSGHFHLSENIADKLSALFAHVDKLLFHLTRAVRWDSDHVVLYSDEVRDIALELVRGDYLGRSFIALDFFDASINRVAAWVIGTRSVVKALLYALLEPHQPLREYEIAGDFTARLALMEEVKTMPFGAVWNYHCLTRGVPVGRGWINEVKTYEREVLAGR